MQQKMYYDQTALAGPMVLTKHVTNRMRQRGFKISDLECLQKWGQLGGDGLMITRQHANEAIRLLKKEIETVERLARKQARLILDGETAITVYGVSQNNKIVSKDRYNA